MYKPSIIDSSGLISLQFEIDSVQIDTHRFLIKSSYIIAVDQESEMIVFGDSFGLKFFHVEAVMYEQIRHFVKYDLFVNQNACWQRRISLNFQELSILQSRPDIGFSYFSRGYENTEGYLKVIWKLARI